MRFRDRHDAGRRLAGALARYEGERPLILGLPRGGVPVAAEVARALRAPLDVLVVRKIGAPFQPEYALGAMASGLVHLDRDAMREVGLADADLAPTLQRERAELERRERLYRGARGPLDVRGRTVIVVDDGLATGRTAAAALLLLRQLGAATVVLAVPVGGADCRSRMAGLADDVVCLSCAPDFRAVSLAYDDFAPTEDAEVLQCLQEARDTGSSGGAT